MRVRQANLTLYIEFALLCTSAHGSLGVGLQTNKQVESHCLTECWHYIFSIILQRVGTVVMRNGNCPEHLWVPIQLQTIAREPSLVLRLRPSLSPVNCYDRFDCLCLSVWGQTNKQVRVTCSQSCQSDSPHFRLWSPCPGPLPPSLFSTCQRRGASGPRGV